MLSVEDADGAATFRQAALNAAALLPIRLAPAELSMAGRLYFRTALALSVALLAPCLLALQSPIRARARRLFIATLVYLPALLGVLVADTTP